MKNFSLPMLAALSLLSACAAAPDMAPATAPASASANANANASASASASANATADIEAQLDMAIQGEHRNPDYAARDVYRHPRETLLFFGLRPDMTVVEIWPGGGWYAEVLAPVLRGSGRYYAAGYDVEAPDQPAYRARVQKSFEDKLAAHPNVYDEVVVTRLTLPSARDIAPPGSADLVLTFRNTHSFLRAGQAEEMFALFYETLKPGGVLGVVQHRANPGTTLEETKKTGYVTEQMAIELAKAAGFVLAGRSEVNANPKDARDHPRGVWTLPPSLRLGDTDRDKYLAIGESDRMTLKFVKPAPGEDIDTPD